jgi:uncharacterized protein YcfJ
MSPALPSHEQTNPFLEKKMTQTFKIAFALTALTLASQSMAQITFYEHDGWRGRAFTSNGAVNNFARQGFNDRASSVIVQRGQWEVCENRGFSGNCMVLRAGSYQSLSSMGMNDRISSARPVGRRDRYDNEAPEPMEQADYEYRRRPNESVQQAYVTSSHAVVKQAEEHCWIERQQVAEPSANRTNVGGAVVGAILGGVLGHQVGGGRGRDLATAGGAVAGAAIGANAGSNNNDKGGGSYARDVRRCETTQNNTPEYWDVTYNYRGIEHRIQMDSAPGRTISVNHHGEPRQ